MVTTSPSLLENLRRPGHPDWDRFVRLYAPLLLHWAGRQGLRGADAEDLAQEVLVKLVRLLPEYRRGGGQSFRDWLFTVTRNQCVDFRRRRATRPLPGADGLSGHGDPPAGDPVAEMDEREYRLRLVRAALEVVRRDFAPATFAAFTAVAVDGRDPKAVAAEFGVAVTVVRVARYRVLKRLRENLDGFLD